MHNFSQNLPSFNTTHLFDKNQIADEFLTKLEVILLVLVFLLTVIGNLGVILILVIFKNGLIKQSYKRNFDSILKNYSTSNGRAENDPVHFPLSSNNIRTHNSSTKSSQVVTIPSNDLANVAYLLCSNGN